MARLGTKCRNCGAEIGIHHYQTNACPVGGREAPIGRKQEYKTTVFEPEIDTQLLRNAITALQILAIANADEKMQTLAENALEELENI